MIGRFPVSFSIISNHILIFDVSDWSVVSSSSISKTGGRSFGNGL